MPMPKVAFTTTKHFLARLEAQAKSQRRSLNQEINIRLASTFGEAARNSFIADYVGRELPSAARPRRR